MLEVHDSNPNCVWFKEEMDGKVVGIMCAELMHPGSKRWLFRSGYVHEDYRRQGIFRKLWDLRLQYVIDEGARIIEGWCNYKNEPMFQKDGFILIKDGGSEKFMRKVILPKDSKAKYTARVTNLTGVIHEN